MFVMKIEKYNIRRGFGLDDTYVKSLIDDLEMYGFNKFTYNTHDWQPLNESEREDADWIEGWIKTNVPKTTLKYLNEHDSIREAILVK